MSDFRRLVAWQRGMELASEVDTLLDLAEMLRFADIAALNQPRALVSETGKVLAGLRKSLRPS